MGRISTTQRNRAVLAMTIAAALAASASGAHAQKPFDCQQLKGRWTGFGWFEYVHEGRKRARCKFSVECPAGPASGRLSLNCSSPGLDLGARSRFAVANERVTGQWSLQHYDIDGTVSGRATSNLMDVFLRIRSKDFSSYGAALKVNVQEGQCRATVNVALKSPIGLKKINLAVRRC